MKKSRHILFLALTVALMIMLATGIVSTLAGSGSGELIRNGNFENGFRVVDGCGMVGVDWGCFNTGGAGGYGFYDDQWQPVVATGSHAQLIEINTKEIGGDTNRTAGIYQTVSVVPGATYTLSFNGMIRADDLNSGGDPYRYVMLVGFTHNGSVNWADAQVQQVDVGPIQDRLNPQQYYHATVRVTAQSNILTVFIAGRMKWGDWYREADFDIDTVSLVGTTPPPAPTATPVPPKPVHPIAPTPTPAPPVTELVCDGPNLLANGSFEDGFDADGTAIHWAPYNNGGLANYGYYDDQWGPVVADGAHAQLLEINSYGFMPTDTNRWTAIHQRVSGLTPGAIYELSLKAMIREAGNHAGEDQWRYEVYWGLNNDAGEIGSVADLETLSGVPVDGIYPRTAPGPFSSYSTLLKAPAHDVRLYLLGLKKWAQPEREVNFDFDAVSLRQCRQVVVSPVPLDPPAASVSQPPAVVVNPPADNTDVAQSAPAEPANDTAAASQPSQLPAGSVCTYVVQPGDYISSIAEAHNTSVEALVELNDIDNPKLLFVGQPLLVPCGIESAVKPAEEASPTSQVTAPTQDSAERVHVVKRGETLSQIAFRYGTTVRVLRQLNGISNPRLIRPGQVIKLPALSNTSS